MRVCWIFIILMGYRLPHASLSQSTCACNDKLKPVCVPAGDNVSVPCPKLTGEDVTFNLLKDDENIYTCKLEKNGTNCEPPYTWVDVKLHENTKNKSVSFMLTGVNASRHGIYKCEGIILFPPPFDEVQSALRILVLVEGHQCKDNKVCNHPTTGGDQSSGFPWIWIVVLVPLSIYSITVTIIALANWVKLRRIDSQSDYINTKPRPPRDRKKKRGVQHPIPRHF